ncbi:MAG: protein translocase subunit SecF [Clostridiales bacterium]|jgi:preprotein translocase SecF subunit|nr:protein translocase subunit SecF [Clostridiales bacterium]
MPKTLPIVERRKIFTAVSICVILLGALFMIVNASAGRGAFSYDVEFSGGTSFQIDIGREFSNDDIAAVIREVTGQETPQVQKITGTNQVAIRLKSLDQETRRKFIDAITEKYPLAKDAITYSDISPTISADMQRAAVLAVIVACICMLLYISIRFRDVRIGTAAILALLHDALIMIAFYAMLRIPLNYSFIAAILTILGYSINATIIIFDRIRENKAILRKASAIELVNVSVSQTLRRSVFTSLTSLLVVFLLYIFGVSSIKEFSLPILIGIIAGTYSSIFLSGGFWYMLSKKPADRPSGSGASAAARAAGGSAAGTANATGKITQLAVASAGANASQAASEVSDGSRKRKKKKK